MKNKIVKNKTLLSILVIAYVIISSINTAKNGGDFDVYLHAAEKLNNQQNIYIPPFYNGLQYYYSVFFALLLIPFSNHYFITEVVWSILSYLLFYRTFILVSNYYDFSSFTKKQYNLWLFLSTLLSFQFVLYNTSMIQVTFFILWAIFESLHQIFKGKNILGGAILGLAINIKLMPLLILPFLFYRGYFKALSSTIITFIILLFIPSIFIGYNFNSTLISEWWKIINPSNPEHVFETGIGTHSLVAILPVYLTETVGEMDLKRNILNLKYQTVEIIINLSRLFVLGLSLLYLRSLPFKKQTNKLSSIWEISFFVLIIPLLLPHQQKYAFLLIIPMISYLLYFFIATFHFPKTIGYKTSLYTFIFAMLIFSPLYGSDIIGKYLFLLTQHYRFLTFASILVIPISLYCSPNRLINLTFINKRD